MMYNSELRLNIFPSFNDISTILGPRAIVLRFSIDYEKYCTLEFSICVHPHQYHANSTSVRSVGAISLHSTDDNQGRYYFFNIQTSRLLKANQFVIIIMAAEVIDQVYAMARQIKVTFSIIFYAHDRTTEIYDNNSEHVITPRVK